jgi:hypothetical protein
MAVLSVTAPPAVVNVVPIKSILGEFNVIYPDPVVVMEFMVVYWSVLMLGADSTRLTPGCRAMPAL